MWYPYLFDCKARHERYRAHALWHSVSGTAALARDNPDTERTQDPVENYSASALATTYKGKYAVPLSINWRKREEEWWTPGAIWAFAYDENNPEFPRRGVVMLARVLSDNRAEFVSLASDRPSATFYTATRPAPESVVQVRRNNTESVYAGKVPDVVLGRLLQGGPLMETNEMPEVVEAKRGPRIRVTMHCLEVNDLPPVDEVTVEHIKRLTLPQQQIITRQSGVNIQALGDLEKDQQWAKVVAKTLSFTPPETTAQYLNQFSPMNMLTDDKPLFVHGVPDEPALVGFYDGWRDFLRDRVSMAKPGKVLRRMFPTMSDERIKQEAGVLSAELLPKTFEILTTSEDIVEAYRAGPSSCTSKPMSDYSILRENRVTDLAYHPTAVYGSVDGTRADTALAVLKQGDSVIARTVVNTERNEWVRIYPEGVTKASAMAREALAEWLTDQGYTYSQTAMHGVKLRRIEVPNTVHSVALVAPYVDWNNPGLIALEDALVVLPRNPSSYTHASKELIGETNSPERFYARTGKPGHSQGAIYIHNMDHTQFAICPSCGTPHNISTSPQAIRSVFRDGRVTRGCSICPSEDINVPLERANVLILDENLRNPRLEELYVDLNDFRHNHFACLDLFAHLDGIRSDNHTVAAGYRIPDAISDRMLNVELPEYRLYETRYSTHIAPVSAFVESLTGPIPQAYARELYNPHTGEMIRDSQGNPIIVDPDTYAHRALTDEAPIRTEEAA